jgi:hypothetical protein
LLYKNRLILSSFLKSVGYFVVTRWRKKNSNKGQQVMLDRDLATLYGVETKRLNEQVKRNIKRFPENFMFHLTKEECLRSQIATLNEGRGQHLKYRSYEFTENGVAMLSSVLRSDTAIARTTNLTGRAFKIEI